MITVQARGRYDEAYAICRRRHDAQPDCPKAMYGMVYYGHRLGDDPFELLPVLRKAHRLDPANVWYRISLALLLDSVGEIDMTGEQAIELAQAGQPIQFVYHAEGQRREGSLARIGNGQLRVR